LVSFLFPREHLPFSLQDHAHPPVLHSFPTRRSSDLGDALAAGEASQHVREDVDTSEARRHIGRNLPRRVAARQLGGHGGELRVRDRKSTRLNSSHVAISYAVFCLKKKKTELDIKHTT